MEAIVAEKMSVSFEQENVFKDLSFKFEKGEKITVSGDSGSGKTTLLNVIAGFVMPQKGTLKVFDEPLNSQNISSIRSKIAWVPQELNIPVKTARELLLLAFSYKQNQNLKPSGDAIAEIFSRLKLKPSLLDKSLDEISGGQKQRIIIASCYFLKKPLMMLDEPTSALDSDTKNKVIDLLFSDPELTLIAASHDEEWMNASDHVIDLNTTK